MRKRVNQKNLRRGNQRERKHHVDEDRVVGAEAANRVRRPVQLPGDGVMVQSRR